MKPEKEWEVKVLREAAEQNVRWGDVKVRVTVVVLNIDYLLQKFQELLRIFDQATFQDFASFLNF